jgi:NAD(P)-dependent dehydrogenase (short-subunit alcohol dehydrogenase family)
VATVTVDFTGAHVFVAGGTSGINLGIAEGFAAAGARITVMSRSPDKVDAAVRRLRVLEAEAGGSAADVRDPDATATALQQAYESFGEIDVLVSGAAGNFPASALQMSPNAFRSVVDIDLLGTYHVLRAAYPLLRKPGAAVINVSAPQAFLPMALQSHVCAAKAGVDMLTRVLAIEWGPDGIRVNAVVPARSRRPRGWPGSRRRRKRWRWSGGRCPSPGSAHPATSRARACCWRRRWPGTSRA